MPDPTINKIMIKAKGEGRSYWGIIPQNCCIITKQDSRTVAGASV
jgi:hypothetical protein